MYFNKYRFKVIIKFYSYVAKTLLFISLTEFSLLFLLIPDNLGVFSIRFTYTVYLVLMSMVFASI